MGQIYLSLGHKAEYREWFSVLSREGKAMNSSPKSIVRAQVLEWLLPRIHSSRTQDALELVDTTLELTRIKSRLEGAPDADALSTVTTLIKSTFRESALEMLTWGR